jgi:hypothetical protein
MRKSKYKGRMKNKGRNIRSKKISAKSLDNMVVQLGKKFSSKERRAAQRAAKAMAKKIAAGGSNSTTVGRQGW